MQYDLGKQLNANAEYVNKVVNIRLRNFDDINDSGDGDKEDDEDEDDEDDVDEDEDEDDDDEEEEDGAAPNHIVDDDAKENVIEKEVEENDDHKNTKKWCKSSVDDLHLGLAELIQIARNDETSIYYTLCHRQEAKEQLVIMRKSAISCNEVFMTSLRIAFKTVEEFESQSLQIRQALMALHPGNSASPVYVLVKHM